MQARAALVASIAAQVQSGATTLLPPPPLAPVAVGPFTLAASFALAGTTQLVSAGNVVAGDLQIHPAIREQRLAATITETVSAPSGATLATRVEYLTLRTFAVPPYVAIDGTTDAAAARDTPAEGDAGDPFGSTASDVRIHALSRCVDNGTGACNGKLYVNVDPTNTPASTSWFNENAQPNGWSR